MAEQGQKPFTFEINSFRTVNTKDSPITMKDDELPLLLNFMPIGTSLRSVPGYSAILASTPSGTTISRIFIANLNGTVYTIAFTSDGALYSFDPSWTMTQLLAAGTLSAPRFSQWQDTTFLLIDPSGYYAYVLANGTDVDPGLSIATDTKKVKFTNNINYVISGTSYSKVATDNFWTLTGFNVPVGEVNAAYLYIDSAGVSSIAPGTVVPGHLPILPSLDAAKCVVGILYVIGPFTGGSDTLSGYRFETNIGSTTPALRKLTALAAPSTGTSIAVFQGRVWVATGNKTIQFSAPDSFSDFQVASSGGAVNDIYASLGKKIVNLIPTQDYLYIVGDHGTHVLSGVQVFSTGSTIFNIIDALPGIGSTYPDTACVLAGQGLIMGDMGVHAISAGSYQLISSYLDGLFLKLDTSFSPVASFVKIYNKLCYCILARVTSPIDGTTQKWLMCFYEGRWFFVQYGQDFTYIMQIPSDTDTKSYACYGNNIIQIFTGASSIRKKFRTKASAFGVPLHDKQILNIGAQLSSDTAIATLVQATMSVLGYGTDSATVDFDMSGTGSQSFDNVFGFKSVEGSSRGKRLQIDFDETSAAVYTLSGILIEGQFGADR